jgi:hypothetical protein
MQLVAVIRLVRFGAPCAEIGRLELAGLTLRKRLDLRDPESRRHILGGHLAPERSGDQSRDDE